MAESVTNSNFTGPYRNLLTSLSELMDWLATEHDLSFVKAGDDQVFAYGVNGYILVFDQSRWAGLIELLTPTNAFTIKPSAEGAMTVTSTNADEKASKQLFKEALDRIRSYYESRYWSTPKTSQAGA
jgi:hypothetical protein